MSPTPSVERVDVTSLLLDDENWRLPPEMWHGTQPEILEHFAQHYDLEEIGWSMAIHGFFEEEPLLTIPGSRKRLIVVEGNRRLATLQLLTSEAARERIGRPIWQELSKTARKAGHDLTNVPVRRYKTRDELIDYLGFRHVSQLLGWTAQSKARYIHHRVTERKDDFRVIARAIGSRADAVRRQYIAYQALQQAKARKVDVAPAEHRFGVFYRALQNPGIREFVGLRGWQESNGRLDRPLKPGGASRIRKLIGWIYGETRVIRDSRQLDDLGRVLSDPVATALLEEGGDLDDSLQELTPDRSSVIAAMRLAYRHLSRAYAEAHKFAGDEEVISEAEQVRDLLNRLDAALISNKKRAPRKRA